ETDGRSPIVSVARPDALLRIACAISDQNRLCQFALLRSPAGHPVANTAAGVSIKCVVTSLQTWREAFPRVAEQIRDPEQVITNAEIQREIRSHPPIILEEEAE